MGTVARGAPIASADHSVAQGEARLSRRASLNSVAAAVDYGARFVVELLLTPLLVAHLGSYLYGAWRVLWQWTGYVWATSGRSAQALQSAIAHHQSSPDTSTKRQYVASAVVVWLMFLPLLASFAGVGVWLAPRFLDTPPAQVGQVRLAAAVLALDAIALTLLTVPRAVLQGENLGYKRMGLSAAVVCVGGVLTAVAVTTGTGLPGVAAATFATTVLTAAVFLRVVRRNVAWFGVARPTRKTLRWFLGLSSWFLVWKLVFELMTASDVLILAGLASVELVTVYVLTKFVADALNTMMLTLAQGVTPGMGRIIGAGDMPRAARLRAELLRLTWLITTTVGATILVWNQSFLTMWVGSERYAGPLASLLIIIMVVQFIFIRSDNYLIDVTLKLADKVKIGAVSTAVSITCAVLLVGPADLGIAGVCLGMIAGRSILTVASPWIVGRALRHPLRHQVAGALRPGLVTAVLFAVAFSLGQRVHAASWLALVGACTLTVLVVAMVAAGAGLTGNQRCAVQRRLVAALGRAR